MNDSDFSASRLPKGNLLQKGFTLIEVLVAVSILAAGIMAIFQIFIVCFDSRLRAESYARTVVIAVDAMENAQEQGLAVDDTGEASEGRVNFSWKFSEDDVDVEDYPKLKLINLDTHWESGKRNGRVILTTYFWDPVLN